MDQNRWVLNRAGILNFWYYDEEEFHFADGKLLLRGANGSGKSVTMQSLIPILLDGRKSPDRLDPFGSRSRRMEDYLLGEKELVDREERTGYLYLEYKKKESGQYITTGIGLQARRYGKLNFWGFVINDNRRIGHDFYLYRMEKGSGGEEVKIPLTRPELEASIGQGGRVVRNQSSYMGLVNRHIFGFASEEAFEELIKLIIQLRSPKLSKDFKPTVIYEILNESLPPLTDDELRPLSDTIENMDQSRQQLGQLQRDQVAVQRLCRQYDYYNRFMLAEKARGLINARQKLTQQEQAEATAEARLKELQERLKELNGLIARLRTEQAALVVEKKTLARHEVFNIEEEKNAVKQALENIERQERQKDESLHKKEATGVNQKRRLEREEKKRDEYLEKAETILKQLGSEAMEVQFFAHEAASRDYLKHSGEVYQFGLWKEEAGAYTELLKKVLEILRQIGMARERYQEADRELGELRKELDGQRHKERDWTRLFEEERDKLIGEIHRWRQGNRELLLPEDALGTLLSRCNILLEETTWAEVREPLEQSYRKLLRALDERKLQLEYSLEQKQKEIKEKKAELGYWLEKEDPEPPRNLDTENARRLLERKKIPHLPFFAAAEFQSEVDLSARERIEGALREMGLLDALILPEQYCPTELSNDRMIKAGPPLQGETLADYLYPTPVEGVAVTSQDIEAVLRSIRVAGQAEAGAPALDKKGRYQISLLSGHAPVLGQALFIGREARRRYREREIDRISAELTSLEKDNSMLEVKYSELQGRCKQINMEYEAFPPVRDLGEAYRSYEEAARQVAHLVQEVEKKDRKVQELLTKLNELAAQARAASIDLPFEGVEENCWHALAGMGNYQKGLHDLELNHKDLVGALVILEEISKGLEGIKGDIEELRREIVNLRARGKIERSQLELLEHKLLKMGAAEIRERIGQVEGRLQSIPSEIENLVDEGGSLRREQVHIDREREQIGQGLRVYRNIAEGWQKVFQAELQLELVLKDVRLEEPAAPEHALKQARRVAGEMSAVLIEGTQEKTFEGLTRVFYQEQGALAEYRPTLDEFQNKEQILQAETPMEQEFALQCEALERSETRVLLLLEYDGKRINPYAVLDRMGQDIRLQEQLLSEKDRELYEEIIAHNVGRVIRARIGRAEQWVKKIDTLMARRNTSGGITFSLSWRPGMAQHEDEMDTRDLVDLLRRDPRILKDEDFERIVGHFKSKIEQARGAMEEKGFGETFHQLIKEVLDYRRWFSFTLYYRRGTLQKRELTNHAFYTFSGGEKAMAMYIPLFSAAYSRYMEAGPEAPFIISLDEAFAGVDEQNIADMFDLMEQLDFNYLINSQSLWGDYETVTGLSICELIRPQDAPFVSVARYIWNGNRRSLITTEEELKEALV